MTIKVNQPIYNSLEEVGLVGDGYWHEYKGALWMGWDSLERRWVIKRVGTITAAPVTWEFG